MEVHYLLIIRQPDGELQVDSFLPNDPKLKQNIGSEMLGAVVDHFQQNVDTGHSHNNGHVEVPVSGVDSPIAGVQQG